MKITFYFLFFNYYVFFIISSSTYGVLHSTNVGYSKIYQIPQFQYLCLCFNEMLDHHYVQYIYQDRGFNLTKNKSFTFFIRKIANVKWITSALRKWMLPRKLGLIWPGHQGVTKVTRIVTINTHFSPHYSHDLRF